MGKATLTRESIIEAARAVAKDFEGSPSKADFVRLTGIGEYHLWRLFPDGGWTKVRELAGIERHPQDYDALSDERLLAEYLKVAKQAGRIPTWNIFESIANVSRSVITRRFGGACREPSSGWVITWRLMNLNPPYLSSCRQNLSTRSLRRRPARTHFPRQSGPKVAGLYSVSQLTFEAFGTLRSTSRVLSFCLVWWPTSLDLLSNPSRPATPIAKPNAASTGNPAMATGSNRVRIFVQQLCPTRSRARRG
jgi:hypothetical protein